MATMSMLGALTGFALFGFVLSTVHAYAIYCVAVVLTIGLTCLVAREKPHREASVWSWSELFASYSLDLVAHPDFFWVFVTRTFYYMGVSLQAFVLFMLRDVQRVDDPTYCTSLLAMIGQLAAAVVAIPSGHLSDKYGRKPLVWTACGFMAITYLGYATSPSLRNVNLLGVAYGIGNGVFLSVDYALACDTLPVRPPLLSSSRPPLRARTRVQARTTSRLCVMDHPPPCSRRRARAAMLAPPCSRPRAPCSADLCSACGSRSAAQSFESAAQGLGVWGVSAFLGSTSGPLIAAPLLAYFGWTTSPDHYSSSGYVAVNIAGALYVMCAAFFLRYVKAR
jgi:MFS family permease